MADNGKINHEKGMHDVAASAFPFLNTLLWRNVMDKRRAIQIITKSAQLYKQNLEDQKVAFHRSNFLHLTGVRLNDSKVGYSIHFYEKCLSNRLTENDFSFAKDGSTGQKLDILENIMQIKQNVAMIGDFTDRGPKLFTQKVAGGVCGCIGFVKDRNTGLNVPNTLLKKDIRDIIIAPIQKVYAVFSKSYDDEKYYILEKLDKSINIQDCFFSKEIEKILVSDKNCYND